MKKILVVMLASFVTVCAFSCTNETGTEKKQNTPAEGTVTEEVQPVPETETVPETEIQPDAVVPDEETQPDAENTPDAETQPDASVEPETETAPDINIVPGNDNQPDTTVIPEDKTEAGLEALSYDKFKEAIGYSMMPYDVPVNVEKNMVHAVTGYNGDVELSYFSFVMRENAAAYMQEIMAAFPGEPVSYEEAKDYEVWKITVDNEYYMAVRIGKTIIFGSSKKDFKPIEDWMYGLGYIEKK